MKSFTSYPNSGHSHYFIAIISPSKILHSEGNIAYKLLVMIGRIHLTQDSVWGKQFPQMKLFTGIMAF